MLLERLHVLQRQMTLKFEEIRCTHQHSGNKGSNVEQIVRQFLREFLPPYNRVGHGEVIDHTGAFSKQIDVIITNEHHPFLNDLSQPSVFIIEGVACAGEVKSILTGDELGKSLANSFTFKSLKTRIDKGAMVHSNDEDLPRFVSRRPYFLFAFESQLSISTVKKRVEEWNAENRVELPSQIDGIFLLTGGNIINFGFGKGTLQFITPGGDSLAGYLYRNPADDPTLIAFLSWLSATMPRISLPHPPILSYLVKNVAEIKKAKERA